MENTLKNSRYNYFVPREKYVICYNTLYDAMLAISQAAYQCYQSSDFEIFEIKYPSIFSAFVSNNFIIENQVDEISMIRYLNKKSTFFDRDFQLTIIPSLDCNLRCWYCYENHITDSKMSVDVQKRVIKHVENKIQAGEITNMLVEFFGGEPLLFFDEVSYPLCKSLKELSDKNNIPFRSLFVTNGSLLNDDKIQKLKELNPSFQVTLDGNKDRHDRIRHNKFDKKGTYTHIIDSIHKLLEEIETAAVTLRINYDEKTLENIEDILLDIIDLDRKRINVHFERVWQTAVNKNNETLKKVLDLFIANKFFVSYLDLKARTFTCKSDRMNQISVNYDGKIYKCCGRDFTEEHCDGVLLEDGQVEWKNGRLAQRLGKATFENHMCLNCKMLPICMGPCSQKQMEMGVERLHEVCMLNAMEMKLEEFLIYKFQNSANLMQ